MGVTVDERSFIHPGTPVPVFIHPVPVVGGVGGNWAERADLAECMPWGVAELHLQEHALGQGGPQRPPVRRYVGHQVGVPNRRGLDVEWQKIRAWGDENLCQLLQEIVNRAPAPGDQVGMLMIITVFAWDGNDDAAGC